MKFKQWITLGIIVSVILLASWYYFFFSSMQLGMVILGGAIIITLAFFLGYYTALQEKQKILFMTKPLMLLGIFLVSFFLVRTVAPSQVVYGFYMFGFLFLLLAIYLLKQTFKTKRKAYLVPSGVAFIFVFFALASIDPFITFKGLGNTLEETAFMSPVPSIGHATSDATKNTIVVRFRNDATGSVRDFEPYANNTGDCGVGELDVFATDCAGNELLSSLAEGEEFCVEWTCSEESILNTLGKKDHFQALALGFTYINTDDLETYTHVGNVSGNVTK